MFSDPWAGAGAGEPVRAGARCRLHPAGGTATKRDAGTRARLRTDLRTALDSDQFAVYYQPICDTVTGRTRAVEALLRWHHPRLGPIAPDEFIPIAEQEGLIAPLGGWVLRRACSQIAAMRSARHLALSVNLSVQQLDTPGFVGLVEQVLTDTGLAARRLTLEVTESCTDAPDAAIATHLRQLRALGVGVALDDFGTGHSTLGRLHALPVTALKIDKSFVDEIVDADRPDPAVCAVLTLAHGLHLRVVAEGVETPAQLRQLRALGCDDVQGFLLHRPMAAADLDRHLTAQRRFLPRRGRTAA